MTTYTYPGVYIEEFEPGAPITGVGTNTAAFIGPGVQGDVNTPIKVTSWDAYKQQFGALANNFNTWYAVRGFFQNGGTVCYIVRATNGAYDEYTLQDRATSPQNTAVIQALEIGAHTSPQIAVEASPSPAVSGAGIYEPTGPTIVSAAGQQIVTSDATLAVQFQPGDTIDAGGTSYEVSRVSGATIFVTTPISGSPTGTIRLADTVPGVTSTFRIEGTPGTLLAPGSVVKLSQSGKPDDIVVVQSVTRQWISSSVTTYAVTLRQPITQAYDLTQPVGVDSFEFKLVITYGGDTWTYDNLSMDPLHPRFFAQVIAQDTTAIVTAYPTTPPSPSPAPENQPDTGGSPANLTGGKDDDPRTLAASDYANAIQTLEAVDDVNLVCTPDSQDPSVHQALIAHCELLKDRFAILDSQVGLPLYGATSIGTQRNALDSDKGYAALYYPWILVPADQGSTTLLVPPSGYVAGVYARTDELRGVHKAPAGEEAGISGAIGVERTMSDIDQGQLNIQGINVIRVFKPGGQPVVWGARTTATDTNWQYVNIRRLFEYIEKSIQDGILWAVFEPNNLELWQQLKRTIGDFLTRVWRDGALFGATADQAFYVRIDDALNPFSLQQLGQLHIEIGCRPSYPAEFIIVSIGIWDGGASVTES